MSNCSNARSRATCTIFDEPVPRLHQEVAFRLPADFADPIVTISGGVAELVYERCRGKPLPSTTFFGDLGIDLAKRLINSPRWAAHFNQAQPQCLGRATVYGLLLHATQISGSTLFLPDPTILPLANIPILGRVTGNSTADQIRDILHLVVRKSARRMRASRSGRSGLRRRLLLSANGSRRPCWRSVFQVSDPWFC